MEDYFYTCNAMGSKIYVLWNGPWLNQLIEIGEFYYWVSLNECGTNWNINGDPKQTLKEAIENAMWQNCDVYQLDTLEELAEFIKSEGKN